MLVHTVAFSARIPAPAASCYAVIADYRVGHQAIIPPHVFSALTVEAGGVGEGTEIVYTMRALGQQRIARARITEPDPGRVLVETDRANGVVTTFTVDPEEDHTCVVTIATTLPRIAGVRGIIERWIVRRFLVRVYREELSRLASYVRSSGTTASLPSSSRRTPTP
jgi:Polyketide cyclase / dehydrase and lipid transport